ncbi:MAG: hypothetical protein ABW061_10795 [Polyangiaceae bacterium]
MRRAAIGLIAFGLFACNAILGNEDHYTLLENPAAAGDAGTTSQAGAGVGGKAVDSGEGGIAGAGDEAGSSGASEAGDGGSAGSDSGGGPCVATGEEDCFNGKDDDCNGDVDCADSACTASSTCVPEASGAELGTLLPAGSSCPAGYSPVTLYRGLTVDQYCTGCTCGVASTYCTTSIVGHGTFACPSFQTSGLSYNMFTTSCQPVSPGTSVHHYAVASFTDCTASGTAKPSSVAWAETQTFCKADHVGRGCESGSSCVPKASGGICARKNSTASCNGAYPMSTGAVWNTGVKDTRTCGTCQCAGGYGSCSGASVQVYDTVGCSGTVANLSGPEGDDCALPFAPASGRVSGTPVPTMCVANVYPSGEITETGPSTVCCQ